MELRLRKLSRAKGRHLHGKPRTQTQVALTKTAARGFCWVRLRIYVHKSKPRPNCIRAMVCANRLSGGVLADADLDHVLGLLLLRELQPLRLYATSAVACIFQTDNSMFGMLQRIPNRVVWTNFALETQFNLLNPQGEDSICAAGRCR